MLGPELKLPKEIECRVNFAIACVIQSCNTLAMHSTLHTETVVMNIEHDINMLEPVT